MKVIAPDKRGVCVPKGWCTLLAQHTNSSKMVKWLAILPHDSTSCSFQIRLEPTILSPDLPYKETRSRKLLFFCPACWSGFIHCPRGERVTWVAVSQSVCRDILSSETFYICNFGLGCVISEVFAFRSSVHMFGL